MAKGAKKTVVSGSANTEAPKTESKGQSGYVWLKNKSYVDDKSQVNAGLYLLDVIPERFYKLDKSSCEIFTDTISARKLVEISKWAGVKHPEDYNDEQIVELLVKEFVPFV